MSNWRRRHLFLTASEARLGIAQAFTVGQEVTKNDLQSLSDENKSLWTDLQKIKLGIDGRTQVLDIHLVLDRKTLRLIDVEDAARLLAARTEVIYLDAIKKRLQQEKNNQPKDNHAN